LKGAFTDLNDKKQTDREYWVDCWLRQFTYGPRRAKREYVVSELARLMPMPIEEAELEFEKAVAAGKVKKRVTKGRNDRREPAEVTVWVWAERT
jgi:hypothetical protein